MKDRWKLSKRESLGHLRELLIDNGYRSKPEGGLLDTSQELMRELRRLPASAVKTLTWAVQARVDYAFENGYRAHAEEVNIVQAAAARERLADALEVADKSYQQGLRHGRRDARKAGDDVAAAIRKSKR